MWLLAIINRLVYKLSLCVVSASTSPSYPTTYEYIYTNYKWDITMTNKWIGFKILFYDASSVKYLS